VLMARFISSSGPALLSYAHRVQQLPIALFAIAISSALMPPLSRAIKNDQFDEYQNLIQYGLMRTYTFLFPATIAIFVLGLSSINLLFGRGEFTVDAVYGTTFCLWAYGVGMIPIAFILLLAPAYYARRDYRTPMTGSLIAVGFNIALNVIMIFFFRLGPIAIAFSTSATSFVNLLFLIKRLQIDVLKRMKSDFIRVVLSSVFAGVITAVIAFTVYQDASLALLLGDQSAPLSRNFLEQLTTFSSLTFIYGVTFFFWAYVFRAKSALELLGGIVPVKKVDS